MTLDQWTNELFPSGICRACGCHLDTHRVGTVNGNHHAFCRRTTDGFPVVSFDMVREGDSFFFPAGSPGTFVKVGPTRFARYGMPQACGAHDIEFSHGTVKVPVALAQPSNGSN